MSKTYNIVCTQCRQHLWVGQRDYIYSTPEHMGNLASFLHAHLNHPLMFVNEESSELDDSEEQFVEPDAVIAEEKEGNPFIVVAAEKIGTDHYRITLADGQNFRIISQEPPQIGSPAPFA